MQKEFTQSILYTSSGGFATPMNASLPHRLAGHTRHAVEFVGIEHDVGIGHPGHLALARAHVRSRHIYRWSDKIFAHEFCRVSAGDAFQFLDIIVAWIQSNSTFGSAKRDVDNSTLQRHERRKRRYFIEIDIWRKANTAFCGYPVVRMLGAISAEDLYFTSD